VLASYADGKTSSLVALGLIQKIVRGALDDPKEEETT
jgi:hypothetical protein